FQSGLALIERLRLSRRITASTATALVRSLSQIPLDDQEPASVAHWVEQQLMPALGTPMLAQAAAGVEARLLEALGGGVVATSSLDGGRAAGRGATVEWEGQAYRVDVAAAERARILAVRRTQQAPSLDEALQPFRVQPGAGAAKGAA